MKKSIGNSIPVDINDTEGDGEKLEKFQELAQIVQDVGEKQIELNLKLEKVNEQIRLLKKERKKIKNRNETPWRYSI